MRKRITVFLSCLCLLLVAGCASFDREAVEAPVNGYLQSLQAGDFEEAAAFEAPDCSGSDNVLGQLDSLESTLEQMKMGDAFDEQAWTFMKGLLELSCQEYKILSVSQAEDGSFVVQVELSGVDLQSVSIPEMMKASEADLTEEITAFAEENAGETDVEKINSGLGKILFDKMLALVAEQDLSTYTLSFQVADVDGSYLITAVD